MHLLEGVLAEAGLANMEAKTSPRGGTVLVDTLQGV